MPRVLVIDDQSSVRAAISIALQSKGFDVVDVGDGAAGISALQSSHFDLAVVDVFMPGMNGFDATKALHRCKPSMPIILMSGFMFGDGPCPNMPDFDAMAAEAGATLTLYKPIRPAALMDAVQRAMDMQAA